MSVARKLAGRLALARKQGSISDLSELLVGCTWEDLRMFLLAFYVLGDAVAVERRELEESGAPLADRLAAAGIAYEVDEAIKGARAKLSRIARSRGRSRRMDAGRPAGPSMAHGCAAVAPAVGPAPALAAGGAASPPDDRFSFCPRGQELPPVDPVAQTQTATGGRNDR